MIDVTIDGDEGVVVTIDRPLADQGSIFIFEAHDDEGAIYTLAADRRPALDIITALHEGDLVESVVPLWAILSKREAS